VEKTTNKIKIISLLFSVFILLNGCSVNNKSSSEEDVLLKMGNINEIEKYYNDKLTGFSISSEDKAKYNNILANEFIKRNDYDSAFYYLKQSEGSIGHDLNLIRIKIKQDKIKDAVAIMDSIKLENIASTSYKIDYLNLKGILYLYLKNYSEAEKCFFSARDFGGNLAYLRNNLAYTYILSGQYQKALDILDVLKSSLPDYAPAHDNFELAQELADKKRGKQYAH